MNNEAKNRSFRMPLIEIIIVIAVFAVISVLLLKLYLSADTLQTSAKNISHASLLVQSCAEMIKSSDSLEQVINDLELEKDSFGIYSTEREGITLKFYFEERIMQAGNILKANITALSRSEKELCDIIVSKYYLN